MDGSVQATARLAAMSFSMSPSSWISAIDPRASSLGSACEMCCRETSSKAFCPSCRTTALEPPKGNGNTTNTTANTNSSVPPSTDLTMTDASENAMAPVAALCSNCDVAMATSYCETCEVGLCEGCVRETHAARIFASHRMRPLADSYCDKHDKPVEFFSFTQSRLMCSSCMQDAPAECTSLQSAFAKLSDELQAQSSALRNCMSARSAAIDALRRQADMMLACKQGCVELLESTVRACIEELQQRQEDMAKEVLFIFDGISAKASESIFALGAQSSLEQKALAAADTLLASSAEANALPMMVTVSERLHELVLQSSTSSTPFKPLEMIPNITFIIEKHWADILNGARLPEKTLEVLQSAKSLANQTTVHTPTPTAPSYTPVHQSSPPTSPSSSPPASHPPKSAIPLPNRVRSVSHSLPMQSSFPRGLMAQQRRAAHPLSRSSTTASEENHDQSSTPSLEGGGSLVTEEDGVTALRDDPGTPSSYPPPSAMSHALAVALRSSAGAAAGDLSARNRWRSKSTSLAFRPASPSILIDGNPSINGYGDYQPDPRRHSYQPQLSRQRRESPANQPVPTDQPLNNAHNQHQQQQQQQQEEQEEEQEEQGDAVSPQEEQQAPQGQLPPPKGLGLEHSLSGSVDEHINSIQTDIANRLRHLTEGIGRMHSFLVQGRAPSSIARDFRAVEREVQRLRDDILREEKWAVTCSDSIFGCHVRVSHASFLERSRRTLERLGGLLVHINGYRMALAATQPREDCMAGGRACSEGVHAHREDAGEERGEEEDVDDGPLAGAVPAALFVRVTAMRDSVLLVQQKLQQQECNVVAVQQQQQQQEQLQQQAIQQQQQQQQQQQAIRHQHLQLPPSNEAQVIRGYVVQGKYTLPAPLYASSSSPSLASSSSRPPMFAVAKGAYSPMSKSSSSIVSTTSTMSSFASSMSLSSTTSGTTVVTTLGADSTVHTSLVPSSAAPVPAAIPSAALAPRSAAALSPIPSPPTSPPARHGGRPERTKRSSSPLSRTRQRLSAGSQTQEQQQQQQQQQQQANRVRSHSVGLVLEQGDGFEESAFLFARSHSGTTLRTGGDSKVCTF